MKKILSTATKVAALALAASSFSFGVGMAENAAKFVGNITTNGQVRADFGTYWNQITAENECKWASIEGTQGRYNFNGCKAAYNWAKENGGHFKFHALVWGGQYPSWLNGKSVEDTKKAIVAWFDAVKKEFPELEMIDVVNEAIRGNYSGEGATNYHSPYNKGNNIIAALGGDNGKYDFVTNAFKMARERWPKAILIYNDYNTIQWDVDGGIKLINTIRENGAPVDAYGLQAHDLMSNGGGAGGTGGGGVCMNYNDFKSTMQKIHSQTNNIPIFISEYDVPSTDDAIQEQCYKEQITYWMEDEYVAGITLWGYIFGNTWLSCHNKTVAGCSGIIKDGKERSALVWLKKYLSENQGVNSTELPTGVLTPIEPVPQSPFKGSAFDLSGKIEAENFDIPGKGKGNNSYLANGACNNADSDYRDDTSVQLYKKNNGIVIGCNTTGSYYQYTINVPAAGDYNISSAVAADGTGSFVFKVGDKVVSDTLSYTGDSWTDFSEVQGKIHLDAGEQILTLEVTKEYIDVDWFEIKAAGDGAESIVQKVNLNNNTLQHYTVLDMQGVNMGVISGYGFKAAAEMLKESSKVKSSGVYYLRSHTTGKMHSVRIAK